MFSSTQLFPDKVKRLGRNPTAAVHHHPTALIQSPRYRIIQRPEYIRVCLSSGTDVGFFFDLVSPLPRKSVTARI